MANEKVKILLTGGGTIGSVSPLLSIVDTARNKNLNFDFFWIGTKNGPEYKLVNDDNVPYLGIYSGKLRRYFDWKNITDLFLIKLGFFQSFYFMWRWQPDVVITAGSFVSVPVVWAAALLRKKIIVHQQDVDPGLANKLMAPFADAITVVFQKSLADYKNSIWIGNLNRSQKEQVSQSEARILFGLKPDFPVLFVTGGGTGATAINELVYGSIFKLTEICQVIHQTGENKGNQEFNNDMYHQYDFLSVGEMSAALSVADVVVSRCGLGTLTELSAMSKPAILIPMPKSHQESNADVFAKSEAAIVLQQNNLTSSSFFEEVKLLIKDDAKKLRFSQNINKVIKTDSNLLFIEIINSLLN